jgi:hypothetical protein
MERKTKSELSTKPKFKVQVLYDFNAETEQEISLTKGDTIEVTQVFDDWSVGRNPTTGSIGYDKYIHAHFD